MISKCQICGGEFKEFINASDKMFNTSEKFSYGLCEKCGCLQEINPPQEMHTHYPENYYSLIQQPKRTLKSWRKGLKRKIILTHPDLLNKFIKTIMPGNELYWAYKECGLKIEHKFLDVGTGAGEHVIELREAGVRNSIGIDPHIQGDITYNGTILVKKCDLKSLDDKFDFIAFHHSLEHIPNQHETLYTASKLLNHGGKILVRIPTVSSQAFRKYLSDWFQLDAPRHLFLHSHESIKILAEKNGMKVTKIWCDSNELQFVISEIHRRNKSITLNHKEIKKVTKELFSKEELQHFKDLTTNANKSMEGDQICVLLEKFSA